MKNPMQLFQLFLYYPVFLIGYIQHKLFHKTNKYAYLSFRKLYGLTQGKINRFFSDKISKDVGKYDMPATTTGVLGSFGQEKVCDITHQIREHGYYVFEEKVPMPICNALIEFAKNNPANTVPSKQEHEYIRFDPQRLQAPMYKFREQDIIKNNEVREIITDMNFFAIAQEYLDCKPINDLILMWWSANHLNKASSEAAQLYHFDMDHLKFLKFFVYLTDVNEHNGPHCYVKKSHKYKPQSLYADQRFSDEQITTAYPQEDIQVIKGGIGTVMAVDTSGIHKGKVVESGERLIFQIEYTNSLFGQKNESLSKYKDAFSDDQLQLMANKPYSFQRYIDEKRTT